MICSYPKINDSGIETGSEVSFKFEKIDAIEQMTKWEFVENPTTNRMEEVLILVPGCCTVYLNRQELNIKADYAELIERFKQFNEMYE